MEDLKFHQRINASISSSILPSQQVAETRVALETVKGSKTFSSIPSIGPIINSSLNAAPDQAASRN